MSKRGEALDDRELDHLVSAIGVKGSLQIIVCPPGTLSVQDPPNGVTMLNLHTAHLPSGRVLNWGLHREPGMACPRLYVSDA